MCVWPASSLIPNSFCLVKRCSASHPVEGHLKCKLSLSTQQHSLLIHCPLLYGVKRFNNFRISPPPPSRFKHLNELIQFYLQIQIILSSNDKFSSSISVLHLFLRPQNLHMRYVDAVTLLRLMLNRHFLLNPSYL